MLINEHASKHTTSEQFEIPVAHQEPLQSQPHNRNYIMCAHASDKQRVPRQLPES
jgi:hypothetical protein